MFLACAVQHDGDSKILLNCSTQLLPIPKHHAAIDDPKHLAGCMKVLFF
jgi:hypothetical protein